MSYGYEDEVVLPVVVTVPAGLAAGQPVRLAARADWLECKEICLPGKAELELTLPVAADEPKPSEHAALFARSRARMPGDAAAWKVRALAAPGRHVLAFAAAAAPTGRRTSSATCRRSSSTRRRRSSRGRPTATRSS